MKPAIITVDETEGQKLKIAGGNYRIIISGKQTNGEYAVIEMSVPPGAGPNPHSHADFLETFYVLEGEVSFKSEDGTYIAKQNSFVNIPKGGIVHGFKNLSDKPAKLLCTVTPAGLDDLFEEIAGYLETNSDNEIETKEKINSIFEKYGQKMFSPDYLDRI
ncbi:cupin domain-containing protein [Flavobacterium sp. ANB]|uniref:cupin domain-containing protein n=1 Tax=unclassified Flavobacterium TaxID=196869 RepID=UPI0012B7BF6E|nr:MULTISPECIES: cupin domain-containing protein [unclassified Flavobacterium]MBF4518427.1 cupin domain-containing protein [Flavobacterium sp. ANB]MTD70879.1 cupin domain-containing protein [Flavobacterium sp. LC2016-13]